jgi:hypothetical protein
MRLTSRGELVVATAVVLLVFVGFPWVATILGDWLVNA